MCIFLCLSISKTVPNIAEMFVPTLCLEEASTCSIGQATRGNTHAKSYMVTENGCSCSIMGQSHGNKKGYRPEHLIESIKSLLKQVPSVSVLVHTCHGNWRSEEVQSTHKQAISLETFDSTFPKIQEDVRYVITNPSPF
jgi:hypothetical protein